MPYPTVEEMKTIALEFCQVPRFAQMITYDKNGYPVGRTLGARLAPDWTVEIGSYRQFHRWKQVKRNPKMMLIWSQSPEPGSSVRWPRVIFAKGDGRVLEGDELRAYYEERVRTRGPVEGMSTEEAMEKIVYIIFKAREFRAEGFGANGGEVTFEELTYGFTWKVD
ncbi:MAG: hypothetical protein NZ518_07815 [Dehalococcoidia bacterium]|nr:hypothetical protein [Dehalococcoidia bacterium]